MATEEKTLTFNRIMETLATAVHKSLKMIFRFPGNEQSAYQIEWRFDEEGICFSGNNYFASQKQVQL